MHKCPHNDSIECDSKYRDTERLRQISIAAQCGAFWVRPLKECGVHAWQCARLNKLQNQR